MFLNSNILIISIFLMLLQCGNVLQTEHLVKTIILFRHGMRAPITSFYFDENLDEDLRYWPDGYGNLVKNGKWQMFNLGQRLHERYKDFLAPYNKIAARDVQVVTTSVYRCYQSANYLLAGFYPVSPNQTWSEELKWQPIPVLYASPDRVNIVSQKDACPTYSSLLQSGIPNINSSDTSNLVQFISNHTSYVNISNIKDLFMFIDYVNAKLAMDLKIPEWISADYYQKLYTFFTDSFHTVTRTIQMCRLIGGLLIKDITLRIKEVVYNETTNSKVFFYSGHDLSLHTIAKILGFHLDFVPSYAASVIFEVYRFSASDYRIQLLYGKNHLLNDIEVWIIPKCEKFCPVGKFIQIVEKFFVDDWEEECNIL